MNKIHPTALIDKTVNLGDRVTIGAYSIIEGNVTIDDDTFIGHHVCIGGIAQHIQEKFELKHDFPNYDTKEIQIGKNVIVREFSVIHQPLANKTILSNNSAILSQCHISHDNFIGEKATIISGTFLGGWSKILDGAITGLGVITHPKTTIGQYSIIAAGTTVVKDVPPFSKYIQNKDLKSNAEQACKRHNLPSPNTEEFNKLLLTLNAAWENLRYKERKKFPYLDEY